MDNLAERELLETAIASARGLGIAIDVEVLEPEPGGRDADALIHIGRGPTARTYVAVIKKGLRPATLGATLHQLERLAQPGLLIADHVTPPMAETLKAHGIAFLDAAGNAYVNQAPLLVWVKGERPQHHGPAARDAGRAFQPGGLKVVFALLCHPEWAARPYRDIARHAGVAHGTVGGVMADLQQLRFIAEVDGTRRLMQPERLLRQWAEGFVRTLRPKLLLGRYGADPGPRWEDLALRDYGLQVGGELAAAKLTRHLRPETITLYGEQVPPRLLLDFKLCPDRDGTVELVKRFWAFEVDDEEFVPLPLIYADLLITGDARCLETADLVYERIIDGFVG